MSDTLIIHCDGACEPTNPGGYATWGFWIRCERVGIDVRRCGCLGHGPTMTNNRAEYAAVVKALQYLAANYQTHNFEIIIRTDSKLVVEQMMMRWNVNSDSIRPLWNKARELNRPIKASFEWIPREQNEIADALSRAAYREALKKAQAHAQNAAQSPQNSQGMKAA